MAAVAIEEKLQMVSGGRRMLFGGKWVQAAAAGSGRLQEAYAAYAPAPLNSNICQLFSDAASHCASAPKTRPKAQPVPLLQCTMSP